MDAATIQQKIYSGYGKAALRTGYTFQIYRFRDLGAISNNIAPIGLPAFEAGTIPAAFASASQTDFTFNKPGEYKSILWSGLFDATPTAPGDYLVNPLHGTYFIAAQQDLLPPLCVLCSRTFSVLRVAPPAASVGLQPAYSGVVPGNEKPVISGFPGAMQWAREGQRPELGLPSDSPKRIGALVFLPPLPSGFAIRERDIVTDDLGRRHIVLGVYQSNLGYRLSVELLQG